MRPRHGRNPGPHTMTDSVMTRKHNARLGTAEWMGVASSQHYLDKDLQTGWFKTIFSDSSRRWKRNLRGWQRHTPHGDSEKESSELFPHRLLEVLSQAPLQLLPVVT